MRFVFLGLLLAITGPTALAVAAGGAQAPHPTSAASAPTGGGLAAPAGGGAAAPPPGPAPSTPVAPPAATGGGAAAPTTSPSAPAPSAPESVSTAPTDAGPGSSGSRDAPGEADAPDEAEDAPGEASEDAPGDASDDTSPSGQREPELVDSRALALGSVPAIARVLAPPADMAARARDVEVSAAPLLGVRDLAQREAGGGAQGRDRGGVDIQVPVDGAKPDAAPSPPVAAVGAQSLPRTGLELVALWALGVLSLTGGFALLALARRLRLR